jgi:hypothetical protein
MRQPPRSHGAPFNVFRTFTSFVADVNLTTQSGCPPYPASRIEVTNNEATVQDIVVRGTDGTNVTIGCPPVDVHCIDAVVAAIESTGTETIASVTAYWFDDGSAPLNA